MSATSKRLALDALEKVITSKSDTHLVKFTERYETPELVSLLEEYAKSHETLQRLEKNEIHANRFFFILSTVLLKFQNKEILEQRRPFSNTFYEWVKELLSKYENRAYGAFS